MIKNTYSLYQHTYVYCLSMIIHATQDVKDFGSLQKSLYTQHSTYLVRYSALHLLILHLKWRGEKCGKQQTSTDRGSVCSLIVGHLQCLWQMLVHSAATLSYSSPKMYDKDCVKCDNWHRHVGFTLSLFTFNLYYVCSHHSKQMANKLKLQMISF